MTLHPIRLLKLIIPYKAEHYFLLSVIMKGLTKIVFQNKTLGAYRSLGIGISISVLVYQLSNTVLNNILIVK